MKVYVVTDGRYSDYHIVKVFSNKDAAEEYRVWHHIDNGILEFDVEDKLNIAPGLHKVYYTEMSADVYPEAVVNIKYNVEKRLHTNTESANFYHETPGKTSSNHFWIRVVKNIPVENFDEAFEKERSLKTLYDIAALVKSLREDGADKEEIRIAINS